MLEAEFAKMIPFRALMVFLVILNMKLKKKKKKKRRQLIIQFILNC